MSDRQHNQLQTLRAMFLRCDESAYAQYCSTDAWADVLVLLPPSYESARLYHPLAYSDYRHFFNHVLEPGMPEALVPVESLYKDWHSGKQQGSAQFGYYLGPSAKHCSYVCEQLGLEIPQDFAAMPDHLALLLEIVSYLSRELGPEQAAVFAASHFDWLDAYRSDINSRAQLSTDPVIAQACLFYSDCMVLVQQFVEQCCSSSEESFDENNLCETETNHAKVEEVVLQ